VFGEKLLRSATTVVFQARNEDKAAHGGKPTELRVSESGGHYSD
jgi:hypothetical protein